MLNDQYGNFPGIGDTLSTVENVVVWGPRAHQLALPAGIVSTAVDAGGSPTTLLRHGLLLGRVTSTGKLKEWNPTGTDGSERIYGVLLNTLNMLTAGTAVDKLVWVLVKGNLKASGVLIPGESSAGIDGKNAELRVRQQLAGRFIFDDQPWDAGCIGAGGFIPRILTAGSPLTLVEADNRSWFFVNSGGAYQINLPALAGQLPYGFHIRVTNIQDQNLTISTGTDDIIALNDLAADSVALSTASEKIGGTFEIFGLYDGTNRKYVVVPMCWTDVGGVTQTVTVAT